MLNFYLTNEEVIHLQYIYIYILSSSIAVFLAEAAILRARNLPGWCINSFFHPLRPLGSSCIYVSDVGGVGVLRGCHSRLGRFVTVVVMSYTQPEENVAPGFVSRWFMTTERGEPSYFTMRIFDILSSLPQYLYFSFSISIFYFSRIYKNSLIN